MRLLLLALLFFPNLIFAQKASYKVALIGFYNLENLYDTTDNPKVNDEEFLPNSLRQYNTAIYTDKLDRLSDVISQMGTDISPDGLALLGVAEIENELAGFALYRVVAGEGELLNLAVHPSARRSGVGRALLLEMMPLAKIWHLEVRESNLAAIALYQSLGFVQVGRRASYYADGEAALLFSFEGL